MEQAGTFTEKESGMFTPEPDFSTPLRAVAEAGGIDLTAPSLAEFNTAQPADAYSQTASENPGKGGTEIIIRKKEVLVWSAHIGGALLKLVPQSLQQQIFSLSHYPALSGHSGQQRTYVAMRRDGFSHNMAVDVYSTFSSCKSCAKNSIYEEHRRHIHLVLAEDPLKFIAKDILRSIPITAKKIQHVVIIIDRHSKLERAVPTARVTTNIGMEMFLNVWVLRMVYQDTH